ncbi:D-Ala-D-Ala carboxypeptidase 3 (S13) family protein [compost metagenome]
MKITFAFKLATAALSVSLISSLSSAASYKFSMNAMCYLKNSKDSKVEAFNPSKEEIAASDSSFVKKVPTKTKESDLTEKFRIASLSKILVTHWAVAKLGPTYRFQSKVHVTPAEKGSACNLYFQGDSDPFLGKEMLDTVFAQLKATFKAKKVCTSIDKISYDDNFFVPFNDVTKSFVVQHRQDVDLRASNPIRFYGPNTTKKALQYFVKKQRHLKVTGNIGITDTDEYTDYLKKVPATSYVFKSRPLHMILREFNAYSFNVPPDILFSKLGGETAYAAFIKERLGYGGDQVDMANGSGYPIISDGKRYNEVSCSALVRTIQDLDILLGAYKGGRSFQLADVMAVGGNDEEYSTFKSLYGSSQFTNTLVAKTGSADEAITFGGMLSTTEGDLYFAVLTKPNSYTNHITNGARVYIRDLMSIMSERFKLKKFDYTQIGLMVPIDGESKLVEINSKGEVIPTVESKAAEIKTEDHKIEVIKIEPAKMAKSTKPSKPKATPAAKPAKEKPAVTAKADAKKDVKSEAQVEEKVEAKSVEKSTEVAEEKVETKETDSKKEDNAKKRRFPTPRHEEA